VGAAHTWREPGEELLLPRRVRDLREGVAEIVHLAPLMDRVGTVALERRAQAEVFVADDVAHPGEPARGQVLEDAAPGRGALSSAEPAA
jgi:hypothetical protein